MSSAGHRTPSGPRFASTQPAQPRSASTQPAQPRFAYCVIISAPRFVPHQGANADAVAAALVNMVHAQLGPRQNALLGLDTRDPDQRAYALRLLADRGIGEAWLQSTPLLYSARDTVFTKPGGVSLQLLLDLASKIQPHGPTSGVIHVLLEYPQRHDLEFEPEWANALEAAERPETRMLASPDMRQRMKARTFSTTQRAPVAAYDVTGGGAGGHGAGPIAQPSGPQPGVVARGAPLTTVRMAEGMDTYADLSVADAMSRGGPRRVSIGHVPSSHPDEMPRLLQVETAPAGGGDEAGLEDSGVMIDIESRMFERMPQILQVGEQHSLTERDMIKRSGGGTDEEATKREIQRVKLQRAEARLGGGGGGGGGAGAAGAAAGAAFGSRAGARSTPRH